MIKCLFSVLGWAAAALAAGCSIEELDADTGLGSVRNECQSSSSCGAGSCVRGMCVAASGDFDSIIVEIVPPASAYFGAGRPFLIPMSQVRAGAYDQLVQLPNYAHIAGRVTVEPTLLGEPISEACAPAYDEANQTLGVHVQLARSDGARGLPSGNYAANAEQKGAGWAFNTVVPAGRYDLYVTALGSCSVEFPPFLLTNQELAAGTVAMDLTVGSVSELSGQIRTPKSTGSLQDWTISLIEPDQQRLVSTARKLGTGASTNFDRIRYQPLPDNITPIIRLAPPSTIVAPTLFWDLSVVDLDGDGKIELDLSNLDLSTVRVRGRAETPEGSGISGATLSLRSTALQAASHGLIAVYHTSVQTQPDGTFELELLPGKYRLALVPPDDSALAITRTEWIVAPEPAEQAGRTVQAQGLALVTGTVTAPVTGQPFADMLVSATASPLAPSSAIEQLVNPLLVYPRNGSALTASDGSFSLGLDPGTYDLAAQPGSSSRYPWLLLPQTVVASEGLALGELRTSLPVVVSGVLHDPFGNPVQQASLRVFAPVNTAEEKLDGLEAASGVLQVYQGRADDNGRFELMLPSSVR